MRLKFRYDHTDHLILVIHRQEAEVAPLVQEIAVDVNAVGLGQILGDQLAHGGDVFIFASAVVSHVAEVIGGILAHRRGVMKEGGRLEVVGWWDGRAEQLKVPIAM